MPLLRKSVLRCFPLTALLIVTPAIATEVVFPDVGLRVAIRNKLDIHEGPIQAEDLTGLTKISLYQTGVRDLTGLEHCPNVTELNCQSNKIENIQSLAAMPQLKKVWLNNNAITDLAPLTELPHLVDLGSRAIPSRI